MRALLLLLACLACAHLYATPGSVGNTIIEAWPAWNGFTRPGSQAELILSLISGESGVARIELGSQTATLTRELHTEANRITNLSLPFMPDRDLRLTLTIRFPDGHSLSREIAYGTYTSRGETPVLARVGGAPGGEHADALHVSPQDLPESYHAYNWIDAIALQRESVAELNAAQRQALQTFVEDCRPLILVNASEALLNNLRRYAGCEGRFVTSAVPSLMGTTHLRQRPLLVPSEVPSLQAGMQGGRLSLPTWRAMILFLLSYCLIAALFLKRSKTSWAVLTLPMAASALALLVWQQATPRSNLILWAERDAGSRIPRATGSLSVLGQGRWHGRLALPEGAGIPRRADHGSPAAHLPAGKEAAVEAVTLSRGAGETSYSIETSTRLLSSETWQFPVDLRLAGGSGNATAEVPAGVMQVLVSRGYDQAQSRLISLALEQHLQFENVSAETSGWLLDHYSREPGEVAP